MTSITRMERSLSASPTPRPLVGWVLESTGRGTLSLIFSCLSTTFLCTWVVLHARVCNRRLLHRLHKVFLLLKTIIAPEFIAVEGLQEWTQARKMVRECAEMTEGRFKLVHAFYIGMLAVRYRTSQGEKVMWPNQYTWLLQKRLINWDDHASWGLSEENIRDKSNADGTAKLLAIGQVTWFMMQSIIRLARHLPLSQLEAMTLSYIPLIAITYFFWWVKPKDVMTPSIVNIPDMLQEQKTTFESMAVSGVFDRKPTEKQDSLWTICYLTPRVFEKEAEMASKDNQRIGLLRAEVNFIRKIQKNLASHHSKQADGHAMEKSRNVTETSTADLPLACKSLPKEIVLAYWDPDVYGSKILWPVMCLFGASFGAIHLIAWNTAFPTIAEEWLWRIAGLVSVFSMLIFMQFEKVLLRWGGPLTIISLVSPVLYLVSRIIMLGGVVAAFRASDPAIYETYSISTYWIHIL